MPDHFFFYLGLSFILVHELDAVHRKEWRIFPGLSLLNETWAANIFIFAHIPLFFLLFLALSSNNDYKFTILCINLFFLLHLALHVGFLRHKKNEFKGWGSWIMITCPAICGVSDLLTA